MNVLTAYHTDVGIEKETNQDSLCIEIAETKIGTVVMAMVCDGMGGLSRGELASANVIRAFKNWFEKELPEQLSINNSDDIKYHWDRLIKEQNQRIAEYGKKNHLQLGTTLTVLLIVDEHFTLIGHVGDTRAYLVSDKLEQITEDQTLVNLEIKRGNLKPEDVSTYSRKNVLLQCIGASKTVDPMFINGKANPGDVYLICSDGFRHEISEDEILSALRPAELTDEAAIEQKLKELTETNKQREEKDNITAVVVKI